MLRTLERVRGRVEGVVVLIKKMKLIDALKVVGKQ